jgi:hypothetical protein
MNPLDAFEQDLRAVIGYPTTLRPFVCNGSPLDCTVFLVGLNPATSMKAGFWTFWVPGGGFNREEWFRAYVAERMAAGPKPGKTRVKKVSPTRTFINEVIDGAGSGVKILETNIYAKERPVYSDLQADERMTTSFDFLLRRIKPRLLVAYGDDAHLHIAGLKVDTEVMEIPHFADRRAKWSKDKARKIGEQIRLRVGTGR